MIFHPLIECSQSEEEIASVSAAQLFAVKKKWNTNQTKTSSKSYFVGMNKS